ncbi:ephexin-1-like [Ciona intestinalis]
MSEDLGTSTLWREIPEVADSGHPKDMSKDQIKLQQSQFEVITSQASYLRSLNILVHHFMEDWAMESSDVLPSTDRKRLFSNIESVKNVEQRFLEDLEKHFWSDLKLTKVCDVIAKYAKQDFSVYILYIQIQVYQDRVLTKLQRNHDLFAENLCRLESSSACNKLPLLSFLLLPMQRVTRLPLLVSAIVNAADAAGEPKMLKMAKHTLGVVNKLVKKCNEGAKKMQQTEQLAEIASQLDYSSSVKMFALVSQSRSLVKKGEMNVSMSVDSKKSTKLNKLWLFLFTDVMFIARKKSYMESGSSSRFEVVDWAKRSLLYVNEQAVTENLIYLILLENQAGKRVEMTLNPVSQNELSRWTNALSPPSLNTTGESIYETWDCPQFQCVLPYIAEQPDELTIDVGDVMQVLKKTSDGWLEGERLRDGETGWFPRQNCDEIEDEHTGENMKNLYRTFAG